MGFTDSAVRLWESLLPVYRAAIVAASCVFLLSVLGAALREERHAMRAGEPGRAALRRLLQDVSTAPVEGRDDAIAALAKLDAARFFVDDAAILDITGVDAAAQRSDLEERRNA